MSIRVLVVEDEPDTAELIRTLLRDRGYKFSLARNGAEGVLACRRDPPDVVVLDLRLPEMDGWEACRKIREFSEVPILVLSAIETHDGVSRALQAGADSYMSKPFSSEDLLSNIHALTLR